MNQRTVKSSVGSRDARRRQQYHQVLEPLKSRERFTVDELKMVCRPQSPQLVVRIVKLLAAEGIVIEEQAQTYRWREDPAEFPAESWIERQIRGAQITQAPAQERPRERLRRLGASQLRTAELLAILIRTGRTGESALQAGEKLANWFADQLEKLPGQGIAELKQISPAISEPAYCQIMARIELGRRVALAGSEASSPKLRITSCQIAVDYCQRVFARLVEDRQQEEFHIVTLDTKYQPIATHQITVGTLDASLVHPREVFRPAIRDAAAAILIVHNHPSGDPTPSREDHNVMKLLTEAGDLIGIKVLDSIIVASSRSLSMREQS